MNDTTYNDAMAKREAGEEFIRVRVTEDLRKRWEKFTDARAITTQRALIAMIDFMLNEDELTQLMILKQVPEGDYGALTEIVLKRLADRRAAKATKTAKPKGS